jgi:hypothetical protein
MELPWKIAKTSVARIGNGAIAMKLGPTGTSWGAFWELRSGTDFGVFQRDLP